MSVRFKQCDEGCLLVGIEDNGVGREFSARNGNEKAHTGKGMSVAIERLQALNEKNGTENSLKVYDLKDEKGQPAGTRIEIILYHN